MSFRRSVRKVGYFRVVQFGGSACQYAIWSLHLSAYCGKYSSGFRSETRLGPIASELQHERTDYDELIMSGTERLDVRALVREAIDPVLAEWSGAVNCKGN